MYLRNKEDTNIDNEFKNKKSFSKKIILGVFVVLLLVTVLFIVINSKKTINYLELNGENEITIYQNEDYIEPGYDAYNSKNQKLNNQVEVLTNIDTSKIGEYEITYSLGEITKTRIVKVIEKPKEYTYIYLKSVDGSINVYLGLGEKYIEPGYKVYSTTGKNYEDKVKITGNVDTNKKGSYQLIYSLIDESGVTINETRTIIVMDSEIGLSLNTTEYTNKEITINVNVIDNYFEYLILPDGSRVTKSTYEYTVNKNGTYMFKTINKKGITKEESIEVTNIDKTNPTGTCTGKYGNGKTVLTVNAQDASGIRKYIIENKTYMKSPITIYEEKKSIKVTIEDKAGNINVIGCNINKTNTNPSSSNPSSSKPSTEIKEKITFSYEYNKINGYMPYALYTPSSAKKNTKMPLIIWLHGASEVNKNENFFKQGVMIKVLNNWKLDGFNAYIICPHLTGSYANTWHNEKSRSHLNNLINKIIKEKNINTNKIIITGASMGGQGALYMAAKDNHYSALVVYSGYYPQTPITNITIPAQGYVGTAASGEDPTSVTHMYKFFEPQFGSENLHSLNASHDEVSSVALNIDKNNDNKSDLIEWMLKQ